MNSAASFDICMKCKNFKKEVSESISINRAMPIVKIYCDNHTVDTMALLATYDVEYFILASFGGGHVQCDYELEQLVATEEDRKAARTALKLSLMEQYK